MPLRGGGGCDIISLMERKDDKPWLTLHAEFSGTFAFEEDEDGGRLSMCCGMDDYHTAIDPNADRPQSFREEYGISAELMHDIIVWARSYDANVPSDEGSRRDELQPFYERLDEQGFALARRLKAEIGDEYRIGYGTWARKNGGAWQVVEV